MSASAIPLRRPRRRLSPSLRLATLRPAPRQLDPLGDLTDALMQGDLDETAFATRARCCGMPEEEIGDLIELSRVASQMAATPELVS